LLALQCLREAAIKVLTFVYCTFVGLDTTYDYIASKEAPTLEKCMVMNSYLVDKIEPPVLSFNKIEEKRAPRACGR
jgi:hypothetical protein